MALMHLLVRMALAISALLLGACVSVRTFENSAAVTTASVEVVMNEVPEAFFFYRNGLDCSGGLDVFSKDMMAAFASDKAKPLIVEANKELAMYLDARHRNPLRYCDLIVSFFPEANARYRIRVSREERGCSLRVMRLLDVGGEVRELPEPSFKRRTSKPGSGLQCQPL